MKEVKFYVAEDGTKFSNKEACLYYEFNNNKEAFIKQQLGEEPSDNNIAIRHNINIHALWKMFLQLCMEDSDDIVRNFARDIYNGTRHKSHLGRYLDRSNNRLYILYSRFNCINFNSKIEYWQPYYAEHPYEYKGKVIKRS